MLKIKFEVNNLSDNLRRIYDIQIEKIVDGQLISKKLELKNWSKWQSTTVKKQFIRDLQKMEELGDVQWIFNKTKGIGDIDTLKKKVLETLKNADGTPIEELKKLPLSKIKSLFPDFIDEINDDNRIKFLLKKLEEDKIFDQIFKIGE